jgi:4-hydroxybenzoate polyprenyltransferase
MNLANIIKLIRIDKPIAILLLFLPCVWGLMIGSLYYYKINGTFDFELFLMYASIMLIGSFCARSLGCVINDVVDRDIDKKVRRTSSRPLANGRIKIREVIIPSIILSVIGIVLMCFLPLKSLIVILLSIPMVVLYPFAKRFSPAPQLFLGLVYNLGFFAAYFCFMNDFKIGTPFCVFALYFCAVCWTIVYDTVYAMQDVEDDIKNDNGSLAVTLGDNLFNGLRFLSIISSALLLISTSIIIKEFELYTNYVMMACICSLYCLAVASIFVVIKKVIKLKVTYQQAFYLFSIFGICVAAIYGVALSFYIH